MGMPSWSCSICRSGRSCCHDTITQSDGPLCRGKPCGQSRKRVPSGAKANERRINGLTHFPATLGLARPKIHGVKPCSVARPLHQQSSGITSRQSPGAREPMSTLTVAALRHHDLLANVRCYGLSQRGEKRIPRNVYRDLCHRHSLIVLPYSLD